MPEVIFSLMTLMESLGDGGARVTADIPTGRVQGWRAGSPPVCTAAHVGGGHSLILTSMFNSHACTSHSYKRHILF